MIVPPPARERLLHPEINDNADAEEKGEALLKRHGLHGAPPMIGSELATSLCQELMS
jgi:hypothetical protein